MRASMLALTLVPALTAGLLAEAQGQTAPQTSRETARQAEVPRTPAASDLQAYALQLQDAESRLRRAKEAAARAPAEQQEGALSREREELAQAGQAALGTMHRAPAAFSGTDAQQQAERRFRHDLESFSSTQRLNREEGIAAAEDALRVLAELRQQVAQAASRAGGSIPAPPAAAAGGTGR